MKIRIEIEGRSVIATLNGSEAAHDFASLLPLTMTLEVDAYLNGKTSTEVNIIHYKTPDVDEQAAEVPAGDFLAEPDMDMYYISIDPRGELAWESNTFGYGGVRAHFIEVLTEAASNAYKDYLRRKRVSYIIAGREQVDYEVMLTKLHELGIERLMVGGGGAINWSFLQSGLVDEVSMVLSPIANGDPDAPRFFTAREPYSRVSPVAFRLTSVEDLGGQCRLAALHRPAEHPARSGEPHIVRSTSTSEAA